MFIPILFHPQTELLMSGVFTLHPFAIFEFFSDGSLQFNILHWPYSIRTVLSLIYMTFFERNNQPSSVS